ncbi:MAG: LysM peptidoglycan-binding domain-containing protein [Telluria sp.]
MKNSSTVATRLAAAALLTCAAMCAAHAAPASDFRPDAPDQHVVVKGDTLWGISGAFLNNPWRWPEVWGLNRDEIRNPHWIYPGQVIYFDREHGRLTLSKPGSGGGDGADGVSDLRMAPQIRTDGLGKDAVPAIPSSVIEPFLSQPMVVQADDLDGAPRLAASQQGHLFLGRGDTVYVSGDLKGGKSFQVFRPGTPLRDPESGRIVAYQATYLGTVALQAEPKDGANVSTFVVASSNREMRVGDLLVPAPPTPIRNYAPHPPEREVKARVMSIYGDTTQAGQSQVVTVNKGSIDGLDVGSVLQLYHYGKTVPDPASTGFLGLGVFRTQLKLPDERFGDLFIFRVFKHVSYGLIMQVKEPVQVGDVANSPE